MVEVDKGKVEVKGPRQRGSVSATTWVDRGAAAGPARGEDCLGWDSCISLGPSTSVTGVVPARVCPALAYEDNWGTGIPEARVTRPEWPEEVGILGSGARVTISVAIRRRRRV
jgi:hypothetical protein